MEHPDWGLKHKVPKTAISLIRGKYYLYNLTSVWSSAKRKHLDK